MSSTDDDYEESGKKKSGVVLKKPPPLSCSHKKGRCKQCGKCKYRHCEDGCECGIKKKTQKRRKRKQVQSDDDDECFQPNSRRRLSTYAQQPYQKRLRQTRSCNQSIQSWTRKNNEVRSPQTLGNAMLTHEWIRVWT